MRNSWRLWAAPIGFFCLVHLVVDGGFLTSLILYFVGAVASVVFGVAVWLAVRLHTSSQFKPKVGLKSMKQSDAGVLRNFGKNAT